MNTSLFWLVAAHPIVASATPPDLTSTITSGLLDILVVAFLLLAAVAFLSYLSYTRSRRGAQARGNGPGGSAGKLGTIASVMLAIPVVWLLLGGGTSLLLSSSIPGTPTPTPKPVPTTHSTPAVTLASDLIKPGKLIVGSVTNNPPQEYLDATSKPIGFDIDLIGAVAQKMVRKGLTVQIAPVQNFKALFDGLTNRQFDVAISAVSMTPDHMQQFDFVPYFKTSESLLVPKGNKGIKVLTDLCGLSVGVQDGSTELTELQQATCPGGQMITIMLGTSEAGVVQLLLDKKVAATYLDTPGANYYMVGNPGRFDIVAITSNAPDEGIMTRKGDTTMFNAVQMAFNQLKSDGMYSTLLGKWGLTPEAIAEIDRRWGAV